jgi:PPM family protein phosphatase
MEPLIKISASVVTNKGYVRDNNEDNFFFDGKYLKMQPVNCYELSFEKTQSDYLFAIFDGMGGENAGEKASLIAVEALEKYHKQFGKILKNVEEKIEYLEEYIEYANKLICEMSEQDIQKNKMGTTFTCLSVSAVGAQVFNLGDSRVYMLRDNIIVQLTTDHTEAERLVRLGIISKEASREHKSKNILSRHLGVPPEAGKIEADIYKIDEIRGGDYFLICSDGLTDMVSDKEIQKTFLGRQETSDISNELINKALNNGGIDNITAMTIKINEIVVKR